MSPIALHLLRSFEVFPACKFPMQNSAILCVAWRRLERMDQLNFTPEERQLMHRIVADGSMSYTSFYGSVLFAPIVFAIYGFIKQDPNAIIAAFLGLLIIFLWVISYRARDGKLLRSIFARLLGGDKADTERK